MFVLFYKYKNNASISHKSRYTFNASDITHEASTELTFWQTKLSKCMKVQNDFDPFVL